MSGLALFASAAALAALLMAGVFALALRLRNFSIVDVAWSALFAPLAVLYAAAADGYEPRRGVVAGMAVLWSLRLAAHLWARIAALHPHEEGRYVELRRAWAAHLHARFFLFFQAQALLAVLLSAPFLLASLDARPSLGTFELAGVALFAAALVGETVADRQLAAWKAEPANHGRTCRTGLWRYSRHPNYFFEWLVWVAFAVFAWPSPWGFLAIGCPLVMLFLLFRVTGIPMTEEQAVRTRGDDYRTYQRTTSAFVPWFPKA